MTTPFASEADLATQLKMPLVKVEKLRRQKGWPHLRFGRFDIRYTPEHIEQIKRLHLVVPEVDDIKVLPGQTVLSAKRSA